MLEDAEFKKDEEIVTQAAQDGKDSRTRHTILVLVIVAILAVLLFLGSLWFIWADKQEQANAGKNLALQVQNACGDGTLDPLDPLCEKAKEVEKVVEEGPQGPPGTQGEQGEPGDQGEPGPAPTAAQVLSAVRTYCAGGNCTPSGPTQSQVNAAVATYCSGGRCDGEDGTDGTNGEDGTDGTNGTNGTNGSDGATGPAGPPGPGPSNEQIAEAVANYCSVENNCKGPKGDPGVDAKPFEFTFTVEGQPPIQEDQTYHVLCQKDSDTCTVTEVTEDQP